MVRAFIIFCLVMAVAAARSVDREGETQLASTGRARMGCGLFEKALNHCENNGGAMQEKELQLCGGYHYTSRTNRFPSLSQSHKILLS